MTSSQSQTTHRNEVFVCEWDDAVRSACDEETFYKEQDGRRYCVLHFPSKDKNEDFQKALKRKLGERDFDFRGVWFPDDVSFRGFTFSKKTDFSDALFSSYADFSVAQFTANADFSRAQFNSYADFEDAR